MTTSITPSSIPSVDNPTYKTISACRACGNSDLIQYLDLGDQPPANSFHGATEDVATFPLQLLLCRTCFLSQLSVVVDPDALYKHYLYASGTSDTGKAYFKQFAEWIVSITTFPDENTPTVLDIASNDGSQLDAFTVHGWETWGVDPAENINALVDPRHQIITSFWNIDAVKQMPIGKKFDVITAQNVFAHTDDILAFLHACQLVMHNRSVLYIQTSQSEMFLRNEFDTVYHEHLSFFNTLAMYNIAARAGMVVENVLKTSIHGDSYVFCLSLNGGVHPSSNVEGVLEFEKMNGLYDIRTYYDFAAATQKNISDLSNFVNTIRESGKTVVGYGAAAKGMTVLNSGKIMLDYIVDDSPLKQNLFTAGMNIPVVAPDVLFAEPDAVVIIPLAWNFADEIIGKIKANRTQADTYIKYFPSLQIDMA